MTLDLSAERGEVHIGDAAPPFALPSRPGTLVDVGSELGQRPVILLFIPLAFSSVCTAELCAVRDDWARWAALEAGVYAISVDSPFVTEQFRATHDLPFPVLSDFNREVSTRYGVLYEDFFGLRGVSKRAVFVIGADGRVIYRWIAGDADEEPDYAAVQAAAYIGPAS